jgi:hypothetical protein
MSQETSASSSSPNIAKPKKRWVTLVLLLVLVGVGLFAVDRAVEGKFFKAIQDTAATTIGGGMNDDQKSNVDKFQKRLSDLRSQREAIAKGEVTVPPTATTPAEATEPESKSEEAAPAADTQPTKDETAEEKSTEKEAGTEAGTI